MKRTLTHLEWVILCGTTALLLTACNGQKTLTEAAREMTADYHLSKAEQQIVDKENRFALCLFQQVVAGKGERNFVCAPAGALYLLNMTASGAKGESLEEICKSLEINKKQIGALNKFTHRQMLTLAIDSPQITLGTKIINRSYLKSANIIVAEGKNYLKEDYRTTMERDYFAGIIEGKLDAGMQKQLDEWCHEQTAGMIPRMPLEIEQNTQLLFANANNFSGVWPEPFSETRPEAFYKGRSDKVNMMYKIDEGMYSSICKYANFSLLRMRYTGGFCLQVVLPDSLINLHAFIDRFSMEELRAAEKMLKTYEEVHISLPKFESAADLSLKEPLQQLGIRKIFSHKAELGGISDVPLRVGKMQQQAKIKVDEWGTTAASVTSLDFTELSMTVANEKNIAYFKANRPFIYLIYDPFGAICYIGTYYGE
ncbi:MAG: serpin family protein [Prevotella sp.]